MNTPGITGLPSSVSSARHVSRVVAGMEGRDLSTLHFSHALSTIRFFPIISLSCYLPSSSALHLSVQPQRLMLPALPPTTTTSPQPSYAPITPPLKLRLARLLLVDPPCPASSGGLANRGRHCCRSQMSGEAVAATADGAA